MNIVMLGQNDPAGMMITFANALNRYTEHTVRVIARETRYQMDYEYDLLVPAVVDENYDEIEEVLKSADIIHFHMLIDENIMLGPLSLKEYIKGKGLLHHHHGHFDFLVSADIYAEKYKRLGRKAIVSTPDLLKLLPESSWQPNMVPLNEADFLPRTDHLGNQDCVRLVQAPTRKWHKHTAEFLRVTSKIEADHPNVETHLLEGKSYRECLKFKRNCHVCFDHMNGWFGIASLESLAHGIPVVAGLDDWNISAIKSFTGADSLPWVVARNESELEKQLSELVNDPNKRVEIGRESRAFLENHWTENHALKLLMETYLTL